MNLDPELEAFVPLFPRADLSDPVAARTLLAGLAANVPAPEAEGLVVEDETVPGGSEPGRPPVPVRIYRPVGARGAVVWLHGGGFVAGGLDTEHPWATRIAAGSGQVVVSVGYRLAPEHPYPAALDDAWAVLNWTVRHADRLGIDPGRIAVGGHSAGGGLAAALALRARDEGGPSIRFQLLNQPQLDDRQETWSQRTFTDTPWIDRDKAGASWRHYLGALKGSDGQGDVGGASPEGDTGGAGGTGGAPPSGPASPDGARPSRPSALGYAAPARVADLAGLPPAYVATAELCPNRDEDIHYALRLLQARVSVELHQWPGTFHGSQAIVTADVSQRQNAELGAVLRRALTD
ncbi:alpha/beta hydrolase [Streptomyces sp. NPDC048623]|uniref:alpha/beta hydrolase n=1 Tax=Streptomyces sp. NPDC048623 TaxID=3155761 RepID=UPI003428ECE0